MKVPNIKIKFTRTEWHISCPKFLRHQRLEKVFRAISASLYVTKMNHINMKKNQVFDCFSVVERRQEWRWHCFTEHNIRAFLTDYINFSARIAWKIKNLLKHPQLMFPSSKVDLRDELAIRFANANW